MISMDGKAATLERLRETKEFPQFRGHYKHQNPLEIPDVNPLDHFVFSRNPKGGVSLDGNRVVEYLRKCRFVSTQLGEYWFNGRYYEQVNTEMITDMIGDLVDYEPYLPMPTMHQKNDILAQWRGRGKVGKMDIPDSFRDDPRYSGWLIPFNNGLYNVDLDEMVPFTPYLFFDHVLHVDFEPVDYHPIEEIYKGIIPDDATRDLFFLAMGYTLFSDEMNPPAIFVLLGFGGTGKSALLDVMKAILGADMVSNLDPYKISNQFSTYKLDGKLANLCTEGGRKYGTNFNVDGDCMKAISQGEAWTVERKFKEPYDMYNKAKLWFAANDMPDFGDTSSGMIRRVHIFPCMEEQDYSAQIYNLLRSPEAMSYVTFKALKAYIAWEIGGTKEFVDTPEMERYKADMRSTDSLMDFITERYGNPRNRAEIANRLEGIRSSDLFREYREFVTDTNRRMGHTRPSFLMKLKVEFQLETYKVTDNVNKTSYMVFRRM